MCHGYYVPGSITMNRSILGAASFDMHTCPVAHMSSCTHVQLHTCPVLSADSTEIELMPL
jgi:hypothetical protein